MFEDLDQVAEEYKIGGDKGGFLKLEKGDNRIRVVSKYEVLAKHWANGKMLGICPGKDKGCEVCNAPVQMGKDNKPINNKPQVKFLMHVIDRKDGELKIAELGWSIVDAMRSLSQDEEYAFEGLPPYDMNIKKTVEGTGKNPSDTSYTVIASRSNTPITEEEAKKIAELTPMAEIVQRMKDKAAGKKDMDTITKEDDEDPVNEEDIPPYPEN